MRDALAGWLGIVVAIVTILGALAAIVLWAFAYFQSADDARRSAAWVAKALADQQVLALRNRINDCDIRKEQPPSMSVLERAACNQYRSEYEQAVARASDALRNAKEASRYRAAQRSALEFFVRQGWTAQQSAGLVANLVAESGLRPDAVGDGGRAYGIAQWHPDRQAIFEGLFGKSIKGSTVEDQLFFVHAELQRSEKKAGDALAACTTAAEAGAVVSKLYERPADREGEATKRAALAERIYQDYGGTSGEGASLSPPSTAPDAAATPSPQPEKPMLAALLPMVLQMFAPRAQAALGKVTGAPPEVSGAFLNDLFGKIMATTGEADPVSAVAALKKAPAEQVQAVEEHALDYLDKLAPVIDKLHSLSKDEWTAAEDSMDRAAARAASTAYDPAYTLTWFSVGTVGALTVFLCAWITIMVLQDRTVGTEVWAALTGMIGWITAKLGGIYDNRFGTTRQSAAKDVVIQQLSQRK